MEKQYGSPFMKPFALFASVVVGFVAFSQTGCAVFSKGRKQTVVVRSTPEGATTKINGTEVGSTPFKVSLKRDEVFRVDLAKNGFENGSALFLPSSTAYDARYLRWGIDYQTGAAKDLIPAEMLVEMKPALAVAGGADRYSELTAQINRADALLQSGDLTKADHKYLVDKILATYRILN
jgi:hypothetical protein